MRQFDETINDIPPFYVTKNNYLAQAVSVEELALYVTDGWKQISAGKYVRINAKNIRNGLEGVPHPEEPLPDLKSMVVGSIVDGGETGDLMLYESDSPDIEHDYFVIAPKAWPVQTGELIQYRFSADKGFGLILGAYVDSELPVNPEG